VAGATECHRLERARRLGPAVNTSSDYENFVVFSPHGRDMLFVRDFTTYYRVPVSQLGHREDE